jgi:hypothetical protein
MSHFLRYSFIIAAFNDSSKDESDVTKYATATAAESAFHSELAASKNCHTTKIIKSL